MKTDTKTTNSLLLLIIFGFLSATAYFFLYMYSDMTIQFTERVTNGEKIFALAPIVIAFMFSFLHGNFTSHFWEYMGFKPKNKSK